MASESTHTAQRTPQFHVDRVQGGAKLKAMQRSVQRAQVAIGFSISHTLREREDTKEKAWST
jgi:hypothetical protein